MLLHLGTMCFFDADRLPDQIAYISGFGALEAEGLPGLVYSVHVRIRKSWGEMTRKLSDTASQ
jgi:hypothetical protein